GVSLNLTDTSGLLATARARAVADARTKAAQYAQALGQPLGPVVSISDQTQAPSLPVPMAASAPGRAGSGPIHPGCQPPTTSVAAVQRRGVRGGRRRARAAAAPPGHPGVGGQPARPAGRAPGATRRRDHAPGAGAGRAAAARLTVWP